MSLERGFIVTRQPRLAIFWLRLKKKLRSLIASVSHLLNYFWLKLHTLGRKPIFEFSHTGSTYLWYSTGVLKLVDDEARIPVDYTTWRIVDGRLEAWADYCNDWIDHKEEWQQAYRDYVARSIVQ